MKVLNPVCSAVGHRKVVSLFKHLDSSCSTCILFRCLIQSEQHLGRVSKIMSPERISSVLVILSNKLKFL